MSTRACARIWPPRQGLTEEEVLNETIGWAHASMPDVWCRTGSRVPRNRRPDNPLCSSRAGGGRRRKTTAPRRCAMSSLPSLAQAAEASERVLAGTFLLEPERFIDAGVGLGFRGCCHQVGCGCHGGVDLQEWPRGSHARLRRIATAPEIAGRRRCGVRRILDGRHSAPRPHRTAR